MGADAGDTQLLLTGEAAGDGVDYAHGFEDRRATHARVGHDDDAPGMKGGLHTRPATPGH